MTDNQSQDICAICHGELSGDMYTLPECSHIFHTNCIMTWFRMKKNTCPLCNNTGINSLKDMEKVPWRDREKAFQQYKKLRAFSRRKNAPKELKKKINELKKLEEKEKKIKKEFQMFKKNKPPENMSVQQIISKNRDMRYNIRKMKWKLKRKKQLIGFSSNNIINIIIPVKQNV